MAGRGNPSYLKRQKEQKRAERAQAKRAAQQARRELRAAGVREPDIVEPEVPAQPEAEDSSQGSGQAG